MKYIRINPFITALLAAALISTTQAMELGTNFWNLKWHKSDDCFKDAKNVSGNNPWNPQFLKEISIYSCYRFMDWDYINNSLRQKWSERPQKSSPDQTVAAYEWMIGLCNLENANMWVCIPHLTINRNSGDEPCDYALRLCLLVKTGVDMKEVDLKPLLDRLEKMTATELVDAGGTKTCEPLKPGLKFYIEYSNETWNGSFKQSHYCVEEGTALNLDPKAPAGNDGKKWNNGFRFHAWAALRIFRAADLVFGKDVPRVVRVFAQQMGSSFQTAQHLEVMQSTTMNPWHTKADATAIAPYFGHKVLGNDPDAAKQLGEAMKDVFTRVDGVKKTVEEAHLKLIAYEGGQHVLQSAMTINRDPAMYDLYCEYLKQMNTRFDMFCHYAHVGRAGERGAWGCIESTGQPLAEAHKYRALVDWSKAHPRTENGTPPEKSP